MRIVFTVLMGLSLFLVCGHEALAGQPRLIRSYGAWEAYVFMENGYKVCYMSSRPIKAQGNYTRRGDVYVLVTNRPSEGTENVFSYVTGYTYKAASDATASIRDKTFTLWTQDDTAWAPDAQADEALIEALRAGSRLVVKGVSSRGTKTTDTFSLEGSSKAHDAIVQECAH